MRNCPVCETQQREKLWTMGFRVPDGWPLPAEMTWHECAACGMIYADGPEMRQELFDAYYRDFYGYGVNSVENVARLEAAADKLARNYSAGSRFVDFGGGDGIVEGRLRAAGWMDIYTAHVGSDIPDGVDVLMASHVLEHIYDLPAVMGEIASRVKPGGHLIIDGPDTLGIALHWPMTIMDYNTKHLNHFTLYHYLHLARRFGFTLLAHHYYMMGGAESYQLIFERGNSLPWLCAELVQARVSERLERLRALGDRPVNIWGLGDVTWHLLTMVQPHVLEYIDNDPAYRGATYNGKPVRERPTNDAPIVVLAQGQRGTLLAHIRSLGLENEVIEI